MPFLPRWAGPPCRGCARAGDCKSPWALHFSVVNAAASDASVKDVSTGYANCRANLVWM